jgi:ABC-2 type transport system ATP-binding protein
LIHCDNLTRAFEGDGVFDISLQVQAGQTLGLLGPTGAGKSVLLRVLAGHLRAQAGTASIFGLDCWRDRRRIFRRAVYAPMVPALEMRMTGEEYLNFSARYHGGFNPQKARRLTEQMDIPLTGQCRRMGQEERKKLGLLAALALDAEVFLLDEPFGSLSAFARGALADALQALRQSGAAVLMTSHVLEEVRRACSHIAIIRQGRLVVTQPVEALSLTRQKVYHITFNSPQQAASFAAEWEAGVELIGTRALVAIPASPQALLRTLARYEVVDLIGGREDAEEGFLRYYGDDIV